MKKFILQIIILPVVMITAEHYTMADSDIYENLLKTVNTDSDETSCSMTADGKTFVFTRKPKDTKQYDIYITEYKNGTWTQPAPVDKINTKSDEISPFITRDGKYIVFSSNRPESLKNSKASRPSFDLYISEKKDKSWGDPRPLKSDVNTFDDETNPYLTNDSSTLFFTRTVFNDSSKISIMQATYSGDIKEGDMITSDLSYSTTMRAYMVRKSELWSGYWISAYKEGKRDIYFIHVDKDGNSEIINPGDHINTADDENSVFEISKDFILISRNKGTGDSFDISLMQVPSDLVSESDEAVVDTDTDTGSDKNTDSDKDSDSDKITDDDKDKTTDTADTTKDKTGNTDRKKDTVKETTEYTFVLQITRSGIDNAADIPLKILFFNTADTTKDPSETRTMNTGSSDRIEIKFRSDIRRIVVIPAADDIDGFAAEFLIGRNRPMIGALLLSKSSDKPFQFRPLFFEFNSSDLQLCDMPYIHELIEYMRRNPEIKISIEGYSDGKGPEIARMEISLRRAESVRDYLVKSGIDSSRIKVKGNGYVSKEPGEILQQGRRVDFFITE